MIFYFKLNLILILGKILNITETESQVKTLTWDTQKYNLR